MIKTLRSKLLVIALLFATLFVSAQNVYAQQVRHAERVVVAKGETLTENLFSSGEAVTVAGVVQGDAYIAAGKAVVTGRVEGDLLVAGGEVAVSGHITQDVRAAGGQVTIGGRVDGNVTAAGGSIRILPQADIRGSVIAGGETIEVLAPVAKSITAGGKQVLLGSEVGGNVLAGANKLILTPATTIRGNLTYHSEEALDVPEGALVAGTVIDKGPELEREQARTQTKRDEEAAQAALIFKILMFLGWVVAGLLLARYAPVFTAQSAQVLTRHTWKSLGVGFAALIVIPVLFVLLLMTMVGIPLALMLLGAFIVSLYFAKIIAAFYFAAWVKRLLPQKASLSMQFLAGIVIYKLLTSLPVVGFCIWLVAGVAGFGALLIQKREYYRSLRGKNLI